LLEELVQKMFESRKSTLTKTVEFKTKNGKSKTKLKNID